MISNASASSSSLGRDRQEQKEKKSHNKLGANQYKDRPLLDDPRVAELLNNYHLKGITDNRVISKLLLEEHGVILGERSVYRRKKMLGLWASKRTTQELSDAVKRQLVMAQMAKDPSGKLGATVVKKGIFQDTGLHLTRDYIRAEMKKLDPIAHAARGPAHVKAKRQQKELENESAAAAASASASTSTSTMQAPMQEPSESGNGLSSGSQNPSRSSQIVHAQNLPQPVQSVYILPPMHFPDTHGQSSTSQNTSRNCHTEPLPLASMRPTQPSVSPSYSQPPMRLSGPNESSSTFHGQTLPHPEVEYNASLHLTPLPSLLASSIPTSLTSSYYQPQNLIEEDHQDIDEDADYSDDNSDNGVDYPQHPETRLRNAPFRPDPPVSGASSTSNTRQSVQTTVGPNPCQPSMAMGHVVRGLQETAPKMQDLTRFIESLKLGDEALDSESYDVVLQGMEAAALLERQLSRVMSLAPRRGRDSGKSNVSGS